jgi:glucuronate isomerase
MDTLALRLYEEITRIPLVDPHTHIVPTSPASGSLVDLLGYHYFTELAHSAGLAKDRIESASGADLVELLLTHLDSVTNTVQYSWLVEIARTFLGYDSPIVDPRDARDLFERSVSRMSQPDWTDHVFQQTNLDALFLTNDFDDPLEGFDLSRYVPCLRTDDLVFKLDQSSVQQRFSQATGLEPMRLEEGIESLFRHFTSKQARACAISLPPDFSPERPAKSAWSRSLERLLGGKGEAEDRQRVSHGVFYLLADRCDDFGLPFDLMIGVRRGVYESGVYQGQDLFDQRTSLDLYRRLFNDKPRVIFPVSVLTHSQNQELASFAWIFPNVVTSGHWWYANIPAYIEADTRARLEAVPATKQIGYYSDAYKLEFVLPKFNMYRRCLARVLASDFVLARGWSETRAVELARQILRGNVERIFRVER